jgi:predicted nucleic acid-binding protein
MIVADVNLLAYLLIEGEFTEIAERAYARDRRWIAPRSHRFELLNVLATNARAGISPRENETGSMVNVAHFVIHGANTAISVSARSIDQAGTHLHSCGMKGVFAALPQIAVHPKNFS